MSINSNAAGKSTQSSSNSRPPSGLMKALDIIGRTRGSSATPAPFLHSPTPQSNPRSVVDDLNAMSLSQDLNNMNSGGRILNDSSTASRRSPGAQNGRDQPSNMTSSMQSRPPSGSRLNPNVPPFQFGSQVKQSQAPFASSSGQHNQAHQNQGQSAVMSQGIEVANEVTIRFQTKVADLIKKIDGSVDINPAKQATLIKEVQAISQEYNSQQRLLQANFDRVSHERDMHLNQLNNVATNLSRAYADRDRFGKERDDLQRSSAESILKYKSSIERLNKLVQHWVNKNVSALKDVENKDTQLGGSAALWHVSNSASQVESQTGTSNLPVSRGNSYKNDTSSIKMTGNSMTSPLIPNITGLIGNGFGASTAELAALGYIHPETGISTNPANPANSANQTLRHSALRRYPQNLLTERAQQAIPESLTLAVVSKHHHTGPGSRAGSPPGGTLPYGPPSTSIAAMAAMASSMVKSQSRTQALVLHANQDDPSVFYQQEFSELYAMAEGWVGTHSHVPNRENDHNIAKSNQSLWAFMMNCTYPGQRQDSHTHTMTLLSDESSRKLFIMRMIISYIAEEVLSLSPYKMFSKEVDAELENVKAKIAERGLAIAARQALVDQRAKAIQHVVSSPDFERFRKAQLATHSKALRDILGPLLDDYSLRTAAGSDLGAIVLKAWDISVSMNSSHLTFQIQFPETSQKFNASTMVSKDKTYIAPMTLQVRQVRLKLVVTPIVTMRDDRGTTIRAKNLHRATVLTMA